MVDTEGLSARATELANLLADRIAELDEETVEWILAEIRSRGRLDRRSDPLRRRWLWEINGLSSYPQTTYENVQL